MSVLEFTVYGRAQPQGSARAFVVGGKARITSANARMKPFRSSVTQQARYAIAQMGAPEPVFGKHVAVRAELEFTFRKPPSVAKKRTACVVKPDLDKLARMACDALTGAAWHDDAQVVEMVARKVYGPVEGMTVRVTAWTREEGVCGSPAIAACV